jgi:hypothetical protein
MTKPCEVSDETSTSFPALSGRSNTPRVTRHVAPESATPGHAPGDRPAVPRSHRVGVAFSEGPKHLPFYENLVKWQLLPLYTPISCQSLLPFYRKHTIEKRAQPRRGVALVGAWANG